MTSTARSNSGVGRWSRPHAHLVRCWFAWFTLLLGVVVPTAVSRAENSAEESRFAGQLPWSFQKPDRARAIASLPEPIRARAFDLPSSETPPLHPIDAFINARLAKQSLAAAPRADRRTLIRRAYFDLIGLPPTPEQMERFIDDGAPRAWEALVAELLASPHYGERWGRHWLDVARYADSGGYETDMYYRHAWRYRDYVIKSWNDDKPFDRFAQEQIAGDELWPDNLDLDGSYEMAKSKQRALEAHTGTGFYALGPQIHESSMDASKHDYERLTDWVDATGAAFLGVTLGCARCHDHKFDPFTQRDYFAFQAIFAGSREGERTIVNAMEIADFKQHYPRVLAVRAARDAYRQFERSIAGRPATAEEQARRRELLEAIGRSVLDVPERATSTPNSLFDGIWEPPGVSVLVHDRPELRKTIRVLQRGDLDRPGEAVSPALPAVLAQATGVDKAIAPGFTSRAELAKWLTRPDHPLTARVIVNRVWQWHFGRGLVATPSDFGMMGAAPSHPELLDWLATEFVAQGWSLKQLHAQIMTSEAYQRASDFAPGENLTLDPDNRLLWKFNRRRLEGEVIWDSIHAVAGTINLQVGGPPVFPPLAAEEQAAMREPYRWVVSADPRQHARRGLYVMNYRNFRFPLFEVFDAPQNAVSSPGRDVSTVAPQSLWLLNNATAWQQATRLAARAVQETGPGGKDANGQPRAAVDRLWKITLGRPPNDEELREAIALLARLASTSGEEDRTRAAFEKLSLGLLNHNEFLFVD